MTTRPSLKASENYKIFIALAVVGKQKEADAWLHSNKRHIERVARYLRSEMPVNPQKVYRGILLPAGEKKFKVAGKYQQQEYVSFTENLDVACWFARKESLIAPDLNYEVDGYIIEYQPENKEILFHHSWLDPKSGQVGDLPGRIVYDLLLLTDSSSGQAIAELYWNLRTQEEVIARPPSQELEIINLNDYNCPPAEQLDKQLFYRPDWVVIPPEVANYFNLHPGQKMNIVGVDFHRPAKICPQCKQPGIEYTYHLSEKNIIAIPCLKCNATSWGIKN